ncbi:MAG TPA: glycerate kinase [Alphaproteobacteria bacterium]|nr:glycerate kinase [Alphaproteobacteria bacterium]
MPVFAEAAHPTLDPALFLRGLFDSALGAVKAENRVPPFLPKPPRGKTVVVGGGKAAAAMAKAVEDHYQGAIDDGLVVTRYKHGLPLKQIKVVEAGHPMPDDAGRRGAQRILELAGGLGPDDLLLCLMSGGGSALLTLPAPGLPMEDVQAINKALLACGATIREINCVRKHLSAIAGGRLARAAHGAHVMTLAISDVPGDDLDVIASGPTVGDPTTFADAAGILEKYGIEPPASVARHFKEAKDESIKPGDPCLAHVENVLIARPQDALEAAAAYARRQGVAPLILGNAIEGEARDVALVMSGIARQAIEFDQPLPAPCVLLSGGETTVTVKGDGKGGRNCEFLLHFAIATGGHPRIHAIACDTDGIDGTEDNAGALLDPGLLARAATRNLNAKDFAARHDSYSFFEACGALVVTGPTRTNVNDFRAIYVAAQE